MNISFAGPGDVSGIDRQGHRASALLDVTALDTGHRHRGIGRYVAGLLGGFSALIGEDELDLPIPVAALRLDEFPAPREATAPDRPGTAEPPSLPVWKLHRPATTHPLRWMMNELLLPGELRRASCRLYHATEPWAVPVGQDFATVVTVHDVIPLLFPEHYLDENHLQWNVYYAWMLRRDRWAACDRIIAISEATKRSVVEHLGVPAEKVDVVHNGIDHAQFRPVDDDRLVSRVRAKYDLDRPFVFYLGGYDYRKNIETLVRAMAVIGDRDIDLVLAGGMDDATRSRMNRIARQHGVAERIRKPGYIPDDDVPALYAAASVFAYPSLAEGFGLQVLEAMALGCPVVTSNVSSLPEVAGDAAFLVDPRAPEELGLAIERIIEDEELRHELRRRGLARVETFSWRRCARETAAVWRELL